MFLNFHCHNSTFPAYEILQLELGFDPDACYFSAGIHPKDCLLPKKLENLLIHPNCLAIGECGLDKKNDISMEFQQIIFEKQIKLSEQYKLPLILHSVKSWNEILTLRKTLKPQQQWIFHGFRKTNLHTSVIDEGLILGIGPAIFYDIKLQELIKSIPLKHILLETDQQSEITIDQLYKHISLIKNLPVSEVADQLFYSFKSIFQKWKIG